MQNGMNKSGCQQGHCGQNEHKQPKTGAEKNQQNQSKQENNQNR